MKPLSLLQDNFLTDVSGCSVVTAQNALRIAARELCERALVWRARLTAVPMVNGVAVYEFPVTADQQVVKLMSATINGKDIAVLLDESRDLPQHRGVLNLDRFQFQVQPTPAGAGSLVIMAALEPSQAATQIDDALYANYANDIAQGARAYLFGLTNQVFSNPVAAIAAREAFDTAIARAKIRAAKAFSSAPLRTTPSFM